MTPERKEEIKRDAQSGKGYEDAFILNQEVLELLAALEESQQQAELAYAAYEGLQGYCVSRGEYDSLLNKHSALARAHREAQQTIARQREALEVSNESICDLLRDQPNELWTIQETQSWLDIGNGALKSIAEVLGDEEGSDKA
ncbi:MULTISPECIES: hypothetical protein [Paenibacillus]|uniref:hypothetical protein n=1 Tax=Paenibacillus TaxID=44249 RepID=UPI00096D62A8|nr:hypothetical protein [Paenibacillus odorifer]OME06739.1 hypothetical protein BSK60_32155 [Paenibacillus odorifer]